MICLRFLVHTTVAVLTVLTLSNESAQTQEESAASESPPAGDVENGSKIYVSYGCYQCHGYLGQGSTRSGPRIAPDPIPLAVFTYIVREPPDQMPGYSEKVMSDEEIADVYAFLKTIPQPPDVESIPELK